MNIKYFLLISAALIAGCTNVVELTESNIEYFGYSWENEQKLNEYCEKLDQNKSCMRNAGLLPDCPSVELLKLAYFVNDVPRDYIHQIGCTATENGIPVLDGKSFIGISKIVPIITTYRENHTFEICCSIDSEDVQSNELCFTEEVNAVC